MTIFIIHGSYGSPQENWFPWLKEELEKLGQDVITPTFPTPDNQSLTSWLEAFNQYKEKINKNSIFIGHSLGAAFILKLLEEYQVKAAFFVAPFLGKLGQEKFDQVNTTFTEHDFNWQQIKRNCKRKVIFHSKNDPYVPLAKALAFQQKTASELVLVKDAGHFNKDAGYDTFEELLKRVKGLL